MNFVLVIEDNPDNLRLIRYPLKRHGYEVVGAETGLEGIRRALDSEPAFIIADIDLPDIDGLEVIRRIRAEKTEVPIVAITSLAMASERERILAAGCNAYFEKPIDPLTIVDHIHRAIGVA